MSEIEAYVYKKSFDSNVITPGTTFLSGVADAIRSYVRDRLASHRLWKNLTVIFSDANCPGEGEHKIMEFIRQERASATYDPNQTHCIYGADADLIMLGLAAH
jgi:5'-3' exoribonuclease 2